MDFAHHPRTPPMRTVRRRTRKDQRLAARQTLETGKQLAIPLDDGTAMLALIQELIPLGLKAVGEALMQEVVSLAGPRYARQDAQPAIVRWGRQPGSIYLADQKLPITVPRVRDRALGREVPLT